MVLFGQYSEETLSFPVVYVPKSLVIDETVEIKYEHREKRYQLSKEIERDWGPSEDLEGSTDFAEAHKTIPKLFAQFAASVRAMAYLSSQAGRFFELLGNNYFDTLKGLKVV